MQGLAVHMATRNVAQRADLDVCDAALERSTVLFVNKQALVGRWHRDPS